LTIEELQERLADRADTSGLLKVCHFERRAKHATYSQQLIKLIRKSISLYSRRVQPSPTAKLPSAALYLLLIRDSMYVQLPYSAVMKRF
jgi:hypothetical protein